MSSSPIKSRVLASGSLLVAGALLAACSSTSSTSAGANSSSSAAAPTSAAAAATSALRRLERALLDHLAAAADLGCRRLRRRWLLGLLVLRDQPQGQDGHDVRLDPEPGVGLPRQVVVPVRELHRHQDPVHRVQRLRVAAAGPRLGWQRPRPRDHPAARSDRLHGPDRQGRRGPRRRRGQRLQVLVARPGRPTPPSTASSTAPPRAPTSSRSSGTRRRRSRQAGYTDPHHVGRPDVAVRARSPPPG